MGINDGELGSEKNENIKNTQNGDLKRKFIKDFTSDELTKTDTKNEFIYDIYTSGSSLEANENLSNKISYFIANNDDFKDFNYKEKGITIYELKRAISGDYLKLESAKNTFKSVALKSYNLTKEELNNVLNTEPFSKYSSTDILRLSKSDNNNNISKLLNNCFGRIIERRDVFEQLTTFFTKSRSEELFQKLETKSEIDKHELKVIIEDIKRGKLQDISLRILWSSDLFKKEEKQELISIFIPTITLREACKYGFYTEEEAKIRKKEILNNIFSKESNVDEELKTEIIESANLGDVQIDINSFFDSEENLDKIIKEVGFRNIEEDIKNIEKECREDLLKKGPQSLDYLRSELEKVNKEGRFNNLNKFSEGNLIEIKKIEDNGSYTIKYIKILKADDDKKEIQLLEVGKENKINLSQEWEGNTYTYFEFFKSFEKNTSIELDFLTVEDIEEKAKDPIDNLELSELKFFSDEEVSNLDDEKKEKYKNHRKELLEKDLEILKDNLSERKTAEEKAVVLLQIQALEERITDSGNVSDIELREFLNFQAVLNKINDLDSKGSTFGLEKGVILSGKKCGKIEILEIDKGNQTIKIFSRPKGIPRVDILSYEDFFQACDEHKITRSKKIDDFESLLTTFKDKDNSNWGKHKFENGSLIAEKVDNGGEIKDQEVEYLVSDKENKIIKINNISGDKITVQFGERKTKGSLDTKDSSYKKDDKGEVLYIEGAQEYTLSLDEFEELLSDEKYNFRPSWKTAKELKIEQPEDIHNKIEGSFISRFFNRTSFNEILAGGKMFVDLLEETFKKGNELHAAEMALKMGKFLPAEMHADLKIKVERHESEEMDKDLESLGKVDSKDAVERIKSWLLNKDTPEHKKEAGLMFMISKYGVLYAKGGLKGEKGKFLWYEAFGGRVNDALYLKIKAEAKASDVPFTEERLMHKLLIDQCKVHKYFPHMHRRSRLYKDYEGKIKQGIDDELAKGEKEAEAERGFTDRNAGAKREFAGGEFNNALGRYKVAVGRGESIDKLSEFPFAILFSGAGYLLQEEQLNEFKKYIDGYKYGGLLFTRFLGDINGMTVFNKTVLGLSKKFQEKDPEHFGCMYDEAKEIFDNQHNNTSKTLEEKMSSAEGFWKKYGEALTRTMLISNNKNETYAKTDKILLVDAEEFSSYNSLLKGYISTATFKDEGIMDDQFKEQGVSGLGFKVLDEIGSLNSDGVFRHGEPALNILEELTGEIDNSKSDDFVYSDNEDEDREIRLLNISRQVGILLTFIKKNAMNEKALKAVNSGKGQWFDVKRLGLTSYIDDLNKFSIKHLGEGEDSSVKKFFRKVAEEILDGNVKGEKSTNAPLSDLIYGTKNKSDELLP